MDITFTTLGALLGLAIAIVLIIRKVHPAYSLILGALIGGRVGGGGLAGTVSTMVSGAGSMMSSVLRILTSGILAGALIKTGSAEKIAETIVNKLGEKFAVPLEIIPGAIAVVTERVKKLGGDLKVRMGAPGKDGPVISDSGNLIADAKFGIIEDADKLARDLEHIVGIVGHGLFVGMATKVILADADKGLVEF